MAAPPLTAILKAIKKLASSPEAAAQATERVSSLSNQIPLEPYSPSLVARSALLSPAAQRGFSESLVSSRAPFASTLMRPSEFLARAHPLDAPQDEAIVQQLIPSLQKEKLRDAPLLWIDEYLSPSTTPSLEAGYEGRHRMKALQSLYGDEPVLMNLIQGDKYRLSPNPFPLPSDPPDELIREYVSQSSLSPLEMMRREILFGETPVQLTPLWMR